MERRQATIRPTDAHRDWFSSGWYNAFDPHIGSITRAAQQLT